MSSLKKKAINIICLFAGADAPLEVRGELSGVASLLPHCGLEGWGLGE